MFLEMQIRFLKFKKNNWLLVIGGLGLSLTLILILLFGLEDLNNSSRNLSDFPLFLVVLFSIIFAPVFEELAFRGFFSQKKTLKTLSLILIIAYSIIGSLNNWIIIIPLVFFLILLIKAHNNNWLIISNSLIFSLVHYNLDDLLNIKVFHSLLFHFSIAVILVWIVINYSLLKATFIHFTWNLFLVILTFLTLQFPDKKINQYQNDKVEVTWKKEKLFPLKESKITYSKNTISISNFEARKIYSILKEKHNTSNKGYKQTEPFAKYNFTFKFYSDSLNQKEMDIEVIQFLEAKNLVLK